MSTFTAEEVKLFTKGGNKKARKAYMATWSEDQFPEPNSSEKEKIREIVRAKYVDKRWYKKPKKKKKDKEGKREGRRNASKSVGNFGDAEETAVSESSSSAKSSFSGGRQPSVSDPGDVRQPSENLLDLFSAPPAPAPAAPATAPTNNVSSMGKGNAGSVGSDMAMFMSAPVPSSQSMASSFTTQPTPAAMGGNGNFMGMPMQGNSSMPTQHTMNSQQRAGFGVQQTQMYSQVNAGNFFGGAGATPNQTQQAFQQAQHHQHHQQQQQQQQQQRQQQPMSFQGGIKPAQGNQMTPSTAMQPLQPQTSATATAAKTAEGDTTKPSGADLLGGEDVFSAFEDLVVADAEQEQQQQEEEQQQQQQRHQQQQQQQQ
jgi:hypothetical protein